MKTINVLYITEVYIQSDYWGPFHRGFSNYFNSINSVNFTGLNIRLHKTEDIINKIEKHSPDFVFFVNYVSNSNDYCEFIKKRFPKCKLALWFIDSFERFKYASFEALDVFDKVFLSGNDEYINRLVQYFPYLDKKVKFLPFATDLSKFNDNNLKKDIDVSFVGTLFYNYEFKRLISDNVSFDNHYEIFNNLLNKHRNKYQFGLIDSLKNSGFQFSENENMRLLESSNVLQTIFDDQLSKEKRLRYLSRLYEFNLSIHGEPVSEWIFSICDVDSRLLSKFKANEPIGDSEALSKLYNRSKISLNIQHHQAYNFGLAMRIFDIMACKSLLITEHTSIKPLNDLGFEENLDFVSFSNENDLYNKVKIYLNDDSKRNQITESAYEKVVNSHTFDKKIAYILKEIGFDEASKEANKVSYKNLIDFKTPSINFNIKSKTIFDKIKNFFFTKQEIKPVKYKLFNLKPIFQFKFKIFGKYKFSVFVEDIVNNK